MPLRLGVAAAFAIVVLVSMSLHAQWPRHPTAGAPRAQGGRVNLDAPTPRTPDGKPDLHGRTLVSNQ